MPRCIKTVNRKIEWTDLNQVQQADILIGYLLLIDDDDDIFFCHVDSIEPTGMDVFNCKSRLAEKDLSCLEDKLMDNYFKYLMWKTNREM